MNINSVKLIIFRILNLYWIKLDQNDKSSNIDAADIKCPHCDSDKKVKNGLYKKKQRYMCKNCKSTFFSTTNTSIHYINNVEVWKEFVKFMLVNANPPSLTTLSKEFKISSKTAHNWKHKFLSSLIEVNTLDYSLDLQVQLVYIPFWTKGKRSYRSTESVLLSEKKHRQDKKYACFICVRAANNDFDFFPVDVDPGKVTDKSFVYRCLQEIDIPKTATIHTRDQGFVYEYFKETEYTSHLMMEKKGKEKTDIDLLMEDFFQWSKSFNGFSTKYIWNYLKWYKMLALFATNKNPEDYIEMALSDPRGWLRFMMINHYYREFIVR